MKLHNATQDQVWLAAKTLARDGVLDREEVNLLVSLGSEGERLTPAGREALLGILDRYRDSLEVDTRALLEGFLGLDIPRDVAVKKFTKRLARDGKLDRNDVLRILTWVRSDGVVSAEERRALESMLTHPAIQRGAKNLLTGFLRALPSDTDALPATGRQTSAQAQMLQLRAGANAVARQAGLDPQKTPLNRSQLQNLLGQQAAEGHWLVAVGAASNPEKEQLLSGTCTLNHFFSMVARGHFGAQVERPTTYRDLRQAFVDAALEHDFQWLMNTIPADMLARVKAGDATPAELFQSAAQARATPLGGESALSHTALVRELAKTGRLDELERAQAVLSPAELRALESGALRGVEVDLLLADANARDVDVVIIGAGMAGLAAAEELMGQGKNVVVLEAGDRVGGRTEVDTQTFGGNAFDVGAAWLHAADENPLTPITERLGFTTVVDDAPSLAFDGVHNPTENIAAFEKAKESVAAAWSEAGLAGKDVPVSEVTPDAGPWTGAAVGFLGPLHMGRDPRNISAIDFATTAEEVGDRYVKEGFGAVVSSFGHGVPVRLNSAVAQVRHTQAGAEVKTWGGKTYRAKTVLCTASTNVMAAGKIAFDPPLPDWKQEAFEAVPLASFNKVALQFSRDVFPDTEHGAHVRDMSAADEALDFVIQPTGMPVVVALMGGDFSRKMASAGKEQAIEMALHRLEKMYGPQVRDAFVKGRTTDWDNEPWAMGAFSCLKPGYAGARADIEKPVGKTLYFAGEAGDEFWAGCVPGAYLSGRRAAERIQGRLDKATDDLAKSGGEQAA